MRPRSTFPRVFTREFIAEPSAEYTLEDDELHYLSRVLRVADGDSVELADGSGRLYNGTKQHQMITNLQVVYEEELPPQRLLFAALIKGNRWETLIEKSAEIGVGLVVPIKAERSVVTIKPKKVEKKLDRWQKILDGAARQCERLSRPKIVPPLPLAQALHDYPADLSLLLDETSPTAPWPRWNHATTIRLGVGPEGGWTEEEHQQWQMHQAESVGLGANLLRAETAAIASLMMVRAIDHRLLVSEENLLGD